MTCETAVLIAKLAASVRAECEQDVREATIAEVYAVVTDLCENATDNGERDALWRACEVIERMIPSWAINQRSRAIEAERRARRAV